MGLARPRVEPDASVAKPPCLFLEGAEKRSSEASAPCRGDDIHALYLGGPFVEALQTAAGDRKATLMGDEKGTFRRGHLDGCSGGHLAALGLAIGALALG